MELRKTTEQNGRGVSSPQNSRPDPALNVVRRSRGRPKKKSAMGSPRRKRGRPRKCDSANFNIAEALFMIPIIPVQFHTQSDENVVIEKESDDCCKNPACANKKKPMKRAGKSKVAKIIATRQNKSKWSTNVS